MPSALALALALALGSPPERGGGKPPNDDAVGVCLQKEACAACGLLASPLLIAFGVATLGVSPVFANVPLPVGVCGIGLGALGVCFYGLMAVYAPIELCFALAGDPLDAPAPPRDQSPPPAEEPAPSRGPIEVRAIAY